MIKAEDVNLDNYKLFGVPSGNTIAAQRDYEKSGKHTESWKISGTQPQIQLLHIYPNPAQDYVTADFDLRGLYPEHAPARLEIISIDGKTIYTRQLNNNKDRIIISTAAYQSGSYMIILYHNNRLVASRQLIIN